MTAYTIVAVEYNTEKRGKNWLNKVIDLLLPWVACNTTGLFDVCIVDMDYPRYVYNRVCQLAGLCALLELVIQGVPE